MHEPFRRSHAILGAEKYGSRTKPVLPAIASAWGRSSSVIDCARPSCQTINGVRGRPESGSHARTVSPWFVSDTASMGTPASSTARCAATSTESMSSIGSCSTMPPGRYSGRIGTSAIDSTRSAASTTTAFVPDVPWSIASTFTVVGPSARSASRVEEDVLRLGIHIKRLWAECSAKS